ncbi:hypothetical protein Cgig2_025769 [Carnegiea gigantea]|uniref:Uncharacterized protein n=1 Tax=Carnegiea gigantea TaxID=171969 RepID=A0A9Q1JMR4_9CARY|nr:hypothetical protein Cgig2_025769 [Carnegiea gigantea]
MASGSGITKEYSASKRYCFSRADLFSLVTALGLGKWLLRPSCQSEKVGAPGNSNPSTTISVTGGVRPFHLGTEPPGPNDDSGEELVEAPSENELLEECPEAKMGVRHLHLRAKNAGGKGVLAAGARGSARLKKENGIGNLFRLPILILLGDASHHSAINKGQKVRELGVPTLHLGASLSLTDVPTRRAR